MSTGSSGRRRSSSCASENATGARAWTTSPAGRAVDGSRDPSALGAVSPPTALTTSSSPSTTRIAHGVGAEQGRRLIGDLVQDRDGVELGCEQPAHPSELLGQRAGGALALVELASLEPAARRAREPAAELEVVVAERALLGEEDDDEAAFLATRGIDRNGQERADAGQAPPVLSEAIVVVERSRREEAPVAGSSVEDGCGLGNPVRERPGEILRQLVRGCELEPAGSRHQDGREGAPERLVRRMRDGVESRGLRERLGERRSDPVEPSLHARLSHALLEALSIPDGKRGQAGECLQEVGLDLAELTVRVSRRDAEHASALAGPGHRSGDRACEPLVGWVLDGLGEAACDLVIGGKLERHQLVIEPVDGCAPQHRVLVVVEVAVGGVRVEQLGHLDDEPLEHGLEPQLARDDLGGIEQCRLLLESLLVLLEQLRRVKRDRDLTGHGLGQRDSASGQARFGPVEPEDADHPVEDEDRSREHGERVEVEHALDSSELGVLQSGLRAYVADGDRSPLAGREIRDRKPVVRGADRDEASASHSARIGIGPPGSPSRRKQRLTPMALPVSSTATRRTASRSSSDRTLRPIDATRRSRSSASASALADRARSNASAVSAARAWSSASSSPVKTLRSRVVASTSTARTFSSETSGTKTALFAPTFSASRRLTRGEAAAS